MMKLQSDALVATYASLTAARDWSYEDKSALEKAVAALERSSFASRLGGILGGQIGFVGDMIPEEISKVANAAAVKALNYALKGALATMPARSRASSSRWHMAAIAASGAVGGAFGLATLPIELPVSTTLILRSIAGIAREEGEDLSDPESALACIEVFALGAGPEPTPLGQSSYLAARALMAKSVSEAARFLVQRGLAEDAATVLLRLFSQIASRFGLVVTQKLVAQAVPIVGAAAGAAINATFMEHYQSLARGHFTIRRLERRYGAEAVRMAYDQVSRTGGASADVDEAVQRESVLSAAPRGAIGDLHSGLNRNGLGDLERHHGGSSKHATDG